MITIENQKQCSKCKEWKPATNEVFPAAKYALGLGARCKQCISAKNRKWHEANTERHRENCRKWLEINRERKKESERKWLEANRERNKEKCRNWRKSNQEKHRENCHKWVEANRERNKENSRNWKKTNPEKVVESRLKRRGLKANADGTATAEQIKWRFQYHENRCYYCGDNESGLHVEHRIPISRGGSNWPSNLVPACPACNLSKHTKTEKEFSLNSSCFKKGNRC